MHRNCAGSRVQTEQYGLRSPGNLNALNVKIGRTILATARHIDMIDEYANSLLEVAFGTRTNTTNLDVVTDQAVADSHVRYLNREFFQISNHALPNFGSGNGGD